MNSQMSPLYLQILLHQYIWRSDPGHRPVVPDNAPDSSASAECLVSMQSDGLLTEYFLGFHMTPKGIAFVENILSTPLPVERSQWVDPRFNT